MLHLCLCAARNKDNSWPEEIIAVMKEVRAKDKENKENDKKQESGEGLRMKARASRALGFFR